MPGVGDVKLAFNQVIWWGEGVPRIDALPTIPDPGFMGLTMNKDDPTCSICTAPGICINKHVTHHCTLLLRP